MSAAPEQSWQSIASAPADETVLIFSRRWGALIAEYSSEFRQWFPRTQCPASLRSEDELTHWMPMPPAPAAHRGVRVRGLKWTGDANRAAA